MTEIKIYVCAHKAFDVPTDPIYIPLQVGAALHDDLGYVSDDTGDQISEKNPYYSELTGFYWMWKNAPDCDYTGLCHYRRYFLDEQGQRLSAGQIEQILSGYDLIATGRAELQEPDNVWSHYAMHHHIEDLEHTRDVLQKLFPDDVKIFDEVMQGQEMYFGNMLIGPKSLVDDYADWLFAILFEVEKRTDFSRYDAYDKRVFGFLSERLLMVWVRKKGLRVCSLPVDVTADKTETIAAKKKAKELLRSGDETAVLQYLSELKQEHPDFFEESSDRERVLPMIEGFAQIFALETSMGIANLKNYSTDYDQLLQLWLDLKKEFAALDTDTLFVYTTTHQLSYESMIFLAQVLTDSWQRCVQVYNYFAQHCLDAGDLFHARLFLESALQLGQKHGETL